MASETGVLRVDPANVAVKGRLEPGRMFLVDLEQGRIIHDDEIKETMACQKALWPVAEGKSDTLGRACLQGMLGTGPSR